MIEGPEWIIKGLVIDDDCSIVLSNYFSMDENERRRVITAHRYIPMVALCFLGLGIPRQEDSHEGGSAASAFLNRASERECRAPHSRVTWAFSRGGINRREAERIRCWRAHRKSREICSEHCAKGVARTRLSLREARRGQEEVLHLYELLYNLSKEKTQPSPIRAN